MFTLHVVNHIAIIYLIYGEYLVNVHFGNIPHILFSFRTLPFIPQKKSASNFPQITHWKLSAFRVLHSAKYPLPMVAILIIRT